MNYSWFEYWDSWIKILFLTVRIWFRPFRSKGHCLKNRQLHKLFDVKTFTGDKGSTTGPYVRILSPSVKKLWKLVSAKPERSQPGRSRMQNGRSLTAFPLSGERQQSLCRIRPNYRSLGLSAWIIISWIIKLWTRNTFSKSIILLLYFIDTT